MLVVLSITTTMSLGQEPGMVKHSHLENDNSSDHIIKRYDVILSRC